MTRYCPKCRLEIDFIDTDTRCPVCRRSTVIETDAGRVQRVREKFIKALNQ